MFPSRTSSSAESRVSSGDVSVPHRPRRHSLVDLAPKKERLKQEPQYVRRPSHNESASQWGGGSVAASTRQGELAEDDDRLTWLHYSVTSTFLTITDEDFRFMWEQKECKRAISSFMEDPSITKLFFFEEREAKRTFLKCTTELEPDKVQYGCLFLLKETETKINFHDPASDVVMMEIAGSPLEHLLRITRDAVFPMLALPQNKKGLTIPAVKEFAYSCEEFVCALEMLCGKARQEVVLPLPNSFSVEKPTEVAKQRDAVRMLEFSVLAWTKQIRWTLSKNPEEAMMSAERPWPSLELDFWSARSRELHTILQQLAQRSMKNVFTVLKLCRSTYCDPLDRAIEEVKDNSFEADSNAVFLETLRSLVAELEDTTRPFDDEVEVDMNFINLPGGDGAQQECQWLRGMRPVFHVLFLVTKQSPYYNTPQRISVMIRLLENLTIERARRFILEGDKRELMRSRSRRTSSRLDIVMEACRGFKGLYEEYKARADAEEQTGYAWSVSALALFGRMDSFIERCRDVQHAAQGAVCFEVFSDIQIGGTAGQKNTVIARQLFLDMQAALDDFVQVPYELLDIDHREFEADFGNLCSTVKSLELRALGILHQAFDDCFDLQAVSNLFVSFGDVLDRETLKGSVDRMARKAVALYASEVEAVRQTFVSGAVSASAVIPHNYPPTAGKLSWSRALLRRVSEPLEGLEAIRSRILEVEGYAEALHSRAALCAALVRFSEVVFDNWSAQIHKVSLAALKRPLLKRHSPSKLVVNFDASLTEMFREAKYLHILGYELAPQIESLYERSENIRRQMGHLGMITEMYNQILELGDVSELSLVQERIDSLNLQLAEGEEQLTWKSHGVDHFIVTSLQMVEAMYGIITGLQANVQRIRVVLDSWAEKPLFNRNNQKTYTPEQFQSFHEKNLQERYEVFQRGSGEIYSIILESMAICDANWTQYKWLRYVKVLEGIICDWLQDIIATNLTDLLEQMKCMHPRPSNSAAAGKLAPVPLIEIKMELIGDTIVFSPPIENLEEPHDVHCVCGMVSNWIKRMTDVLQLATHDTTVFEYHDRVLCDPRVTGLLSEVELELEELRTEAEVYEESFSDYEFLWQLDPQANFDEFLEEEGMPPGALIPAIGCFDERTSALAELTETLIAVEELEQVLWMRIDARPLKAALLTRISVWANMYHAFLTGFVREKIQSINTFIRNTRMELSAAVDVRTGNDLLLPLVLRANRRIQQERHHLDSVIIPLTDISSFLDERRSSSSMSTARQHHRISKEDAEKLRSLLVEWADLQKYSLQVKERYSPYIAVEVERLKQRALKLDDSCSKTLMLVQGAEFWQYSCGSEKAYNNIDELYMQCWSLEMELQEIRVLETLLEHETGLKHAALEQCVTELCCGKQLWDMSCLATSTFQEWAKVAWIDVDIAAKSEVAKGFEKMLDAIPPSCYESDAFQGLRNQIREMIAALPLSAMIMEPWIRQRHLKQLMGISQVIVTVDKNMTFADALNLRLPQISEDVISIAGNAKKELELEQSLMKIDRLWNDLEIEAMLHTETQIKILSSSSQVAVQQLEELHVEVLTILHSRFISVFREVAVDLQKTLAWAEALLSSVLALQGKWLLLKGLFSHHIEFASPLYEQKKVFASVDDAFQELVSEIISHSRVKDMCSIPSLHEKLDQLHARVNNCENNLSGWLQMRRVGFPRLFFVSDQELTHILSEGARSPKMIMNALPKIFSGIHSLRFASRISASGKEVLGIYNEDQEYVPFEIELSFYDGRNMELWLKDLLAKMQDSLSTGLFHAVKQSATSGLTQWIQSECTQNCVVAAKVIFTKEVDRALDAVAAADREAINNLLSFHQSATAELFQSLKGADASNIQRKKVAALLVWEAQACAVLELLRGNGPRGERASAMVASSREAFEWQTQWRFYLRFDTTDRSHLTESERAEAESKCRACIGGAHVDYGFEFLGRKTRFYLDPSTNRAMISIVTTLKNLLVVGLGFSMFAERVGKSETFLELGASLGKMTPMHSFSAHTVGDTIFDVLAGLSQCGAWGLLVGFDMIPTDILSGVAAAIRDIFSGLRAKSVCKVNGLDIIVNLHFGLFVANTEHHTGSLARLPPDMKHLVRPVAMQRLELAAVAETLLLSLGFVQHRYLADKLSMFMRVCSTLYSTKTHYVWDMRLLASIVNSAGQQLYDDPQADEELLLIQLLISRCLAMLEQDDMNMLPFIVSKVFPNFGQRHINLLYHKTSTVRETMILGLNKFSLVPGDAVVNKLQQLHALLQMQFSAFLLGESGCGKTKLWKALAKISLDGSKTTWQALNPNSLLPGLFCGFIRTDGSWNPGAFNVMAKHINNNASPGHNQWIVLDGEATPLWTDLLATVIGNTRSLQLPTRERIDFGPHVRILFETCRLEHANPAVVARGGMLCMTKADVGVDAIVDSWIRNLHRLSIKITMAYLFKRRLFQIVSFFKDSNLQYSVPVCEVSCLHSMLRILDGLIHAESWTGKDRQHFDIEKICQMMFSFAAIWGFGGALAADRNQDCRRRFSDWWRSTFETYGGEAIPNIGTVFDYTFELQTYTLCSWKDMMSNTKYLGHATIDDIVVTTPMQVSLLRLLSVHTTQKNSVLLVGEDGVGKTCALDEHFTSLPDDFSSSRIALHSYADSGDLQHRMGSELVKKAGNVYGPAGQRRMVFFIDDLSRPRPNDFGVRSTAALLLQHMDYAIWYDTSTLLPHKVVNVQYHGAMSSHNHGIGRRTIQRFTTVTVPAPHESTVASMYDSIMSSCMKHFPQEIRECSSQSLACVAGYVHTRLALSFESVIFPSFYSFTLHEVRALIKALSRASPELYGNVQVYVSLFIHEFARVYRDRLFSDTDVKLYEGLMKDGLRKFVDPSLLSSPSVASTIHAVDLSTLTLAPSAQSIERWDTIFRDKLADYNTLFPTLEVELWTAAVKQILRIIRLLTTPGGHMVFAGNQGLHKEKLVRLAAFACGMQFVTPAIRIGYDLESFRQDLEQHFSWVGVHGEDRVFILREEDMLDERFLVLITQLLGSSFPFSSGRLSADAAAPNLQFLSGVNKADLIRQMKVAQGREGELENTQACWKELIAQAKARLHLVFCMSQSMLERLAKTQVFVPHRCYINAMQPWDRESMNEIACTRLAEIEFSPDPAADEKLRYSIEHLCVGLHKSMASVGHRFAEEHSVKYVVSSCHFSYFIDVLLDLMTKTRTELASSVEHLELILERINDINVHTETLWQNKEAWIEDIKMQNGIVDDLLVQVGQKTSEFEQQRELVKQLDREATEIAGLVQAKEQDLSRIRKQVEPPLVLAKDGLRTLNKESLAAMKAFSSPPEAVEKVFGCILYLTSRPGNLAPDISWAKTRRTMASVDRFMIELQQLDAEKVPAEATDMIMPFLSDAALQPEPLEKVNKAAAILFEWVRRVVQYNYAFRNNILPLEKSMKALEVRLQEANKKVSQATAAQSTLEAAQADLSTQFEEATKQKSAMSNALDDAAKAHERAMVLCEELNQHSDRWKADLERLKQRQTHLLGDAVVAAALVTYGGLLNQLYRSHLRRACRSELGGVEIAATDQDSCLDMLASDKQRCSWHNLGLPHSYFEVQHKWALENCAIAHTSPRTAIFVDPDNQALWWFRAMQGAGQLRHLDGRTDYLSTLCECISDGQPVAFTVSDRLDPILQSILTLKILRKGKEQYLLVGSERIPFSRSFRLLYRTESPRPDFPNNVHCEATIINFELGQRELQEHVHCMMAAALWFSLEHRRKDAVKKILNLTVEVSDNEDAVLKHLSETPADLSGDEEVYNVRTSLHELVQNRDVLQSSLATMDAVREQVSSLAPLAKCISYIMAPNNYLRRYSPAKVVSTSLLMHSLALSFLRIIKPGDQEGQLPGSFNREELLQAATAAASGHLLGSLGTSQSLLVRVLLFLLQLVGQGTIKESLVGMFMAGQAIQEREEATEAIDEEVARMKRNLMANVTSRKNVMSPLRLRLQKEARALGSLAVVTNKIFKPGSAQNEIGSYIPKAQWDLLLAFAGGLHNLKFLPGALQGDAVWKQWYEAAYTDDEKLPTDHPLTTADKIFIYRALKPSAMVAVLNRYLPASQLELKDNVSVQSVSQAISYAGSGPDQELLHPAMCLSAPLPILFVCDDTFDPFLLVELLGKKQGYTLDQHKMSVLSACAKDVAEQMQKAAVEGDWVIIKALHQRPQAMQEIHRWLEATALSLYEGAIIGSAIRPKRDFRLFLSIHPSATLDTGLSIRTLKLFVDQPSGLKPLISRYSAVMPLHESSDEDTAGTELLNTSFKKVFFIHLISQRLLRNSAMTWNYKYEFVLQDALHVCDTLPLLLGKSEGEREQEQEQAEAGPGVDFLLSAEQVPWRELRFMVADVLYGCKIADRFDQRLCQRIAHVAFPDEHETDMPKMEQIQAILGVDLRQEEDPQPNNEEFLQRCALMVGSMNKPRSNVVFYDETMEIAEQIAAVLPSWNLEVQQLVNMDLFEGDHRPFVHVLLNECRILNELKRQIALTLEEIEMIVDSKSALVSSIAAAWRKADLLARRTVLPEWIACSYPTSRALGSWLADMQLRFEQAREWSKHPPQCVPTLWLGGLCRPRACIGALLLLLACPNDIPAERVALEVVAADPEEIGHEDDKERKKRMQGGTDRLSVRGMLLCGAQWDVDSATIKPPGAAPACPLPVVSLVVRDSEEFEDLSSVCPVPAFQSRARGDTFVCSLKFRVQSSTARDEPSPFLAGSCVVLEDGT